jgi:hypothetical protein
MARADAARRISSAPASAAGLDRLCSAAPSVGSSPVAAAAAAAAAAASTRCSSPGCCTRSLAAASAASTVGSGQRAAEGQPLMHASHQADLETSGGQGPGAAAWSGTRGEPSQAR